MDTFKAAGDTRDESRLDSVKIPGFMTQHLLFEWTVTNTDGQKNGGQPVRGILFTARLPDELRNEDEIIVRIIPPAACGLGMSCGPQPAVVDTPDPWSYPRGFCEGALDLLRGRFTS